MEKDFNIDSDPRDLLLKKAFLMFDEKDALTQKISDALAYSILNSNEIININASKEKEFFKKINVIDKKSFFTGNKLWLISFFLITGLCSLAYFYFKSKEAVHVNRAVSIQNEAITSLPKTIMTKSLADVKKITSKNDFFKFKQSRI